MKIFIICIILSILTSINIYAINYPPNFLEAIKITLKFEGGYFAEEETNFGIMQGTYNAYRISKKLPLEDIKNITKDEIYDCYYKRYYLKCDCDSIPIEVSIVHFDSCVNFGVTASTEMLNNTIAKYPELKGKELAIKYCDTRIERRYDIVERKPAKKKFLKGWLKRDNKLKTIIEKL